MLKKISTVAVTLAFVSLLSSYILLLPSLPSTTPSQASGGSAEEVTAGRTLETAEVRAIPLIPFPREAYERGYADGLVMIRPEVESGVVRARRGAVIRIKLAFTYRGRASAPDEVEVVFSTGGFRVEVPALFTLPNGTKVVRYVCLNDFVEIEQISVRVKKGGSREVWLSVTFPEDFPLEGVKALAPGPVALPFDAKVLADGVVVDVDPPLTVVF